MFTNSKLALLIILSSFSMFSTLINAEPRMSAQVTVPLVVKGEQPIPVLPKKIITPRNKLHSLQVIENKKSNLPYKGLPIKSKIELKTPVSSNEIKDTTQGGLKIIENGSLVTQNINNEIASKDNASVTASNTTADNTVAKNNNEVKDIKKTKDVKDKEIANKDATPSAVVAIPNNSKENQDFHASNNNINALMKEIKALKTDLAEIKQLLLKKNAK